MVYIRGGECDGRKIIITKVMVQILIIDNNNNNGGDFENDFKNNNNNSDKCNIYYDSDNSNDKMNDYDNDEIDENSNEYNHNSDKNNDSNDNDEILLIVTNTTEASFSIVLFPCVIGDCFVVTRACVVVVEAHVHIYVHHEVSTEQFM